MRLQKFNIKIMFNLIISNNDDKIHNDEIKNVSMIFFKMHIFV